MLRVDVCLALRDTKLTPTPVPMEIMSELLLEEADRHYLAMDKLLRVSPDCVGSHLSTQVQEDFRGWLKGRIVSVLRAGVVPVGRDGASMTPCRGTDSAVKDTRDPGQLNQQGLEFRLISVKKCNRFSWVLETGDWSVCRACLHHCPRPICLLSPLTPAPAHPLPILDLSFILPG